MNWKSPQGIGYGKELETVGNYGMGRMRERAYGKERKRSCKRRIQTKNLDRKERK